MTVIQTEAGLQSYTPAPYPRMVAQSLPVYESGSLDYAAIYRTQSNVRTVVDFLARNIAQLGLHVFRRAGDNDRERLNAHPLQRLIDRPSARTSRYRLIESSMVDLGIWWNAFLLKIGTTNPVGLVRIPPRYVQVAGFLEPTQYIIRFPGKPPIELDPELIIHLRGPNPDDARMGLSPLETLRREIAETESASNYREYLWANAARMSGVIERPVEAADWSPEARERFQAEFDALYSGAANSGRTAVLEDGMSWKAQSFSATDSQYIEGRKLTREEVARAYHIPLPMVGLLDHATFSNIEEQHRNLYQDCLGPWLTMWQEDLGIQLVPSFDDIADVYLEFNLAEKMRGSFEEQVKSFSTAVGRPYMTPNEARSKLNMPRLEGDADELATPLNVIVGGQASPTDSAPPPKSLPSNSYTGKSDTAEGKGFDPEFPRVRSAHVRKWESELKRFFKRQQNAALGSVPKSAVKDYLLITDVFELERWNRELSEDLFRLSMATSTEFATRVTEQYGAEFDDTELIDYYRDNSRWAAEGINGVTRSAILRALGDAEVRVAVAHVFDVAMSSRAPQIAQTKVTQTANNGSHRGAAQSGVKTKTWRVNSGNPRSAHADMNGERVHLSARFSNGMLWPGDPSASVGAEDVANCQCSCEFD